MPIISFSPYTGLSKLPANEVASCTIRIPIADARILRDAWGGDGILSSLAHSIIYVAANELRSKPSDGTTNISVITALIARLTSDRTPPVRQPDNQPTPGIQHLDALVGTTQTIHHNPPAIPHLPSAESPSDGRKRRSVAKKPKTHRSPRSS